MLQLTFVIATLVVGTEAQVHGGWSPWELDPEVDCCMYGGYERVKRYCNNPVPEQGGEMCTNTAGDLADQELRWRFCECSCYPACDPVHRTAFCANDTGKPAHCLCNYGWQVPDNHDPNDVVVCVEAVSATTAAPMTTTESFGMSIGTKDAFEIINYVTIAWLIIWIIATMLVASSSCAWTTIRIIHFQQEITLMITYLLIGAAVERITDEGSCRMVALVVQYAFLCVMTFFCLEALHTYSVVTFVTGTDGVLPALAHVLLGYGSPLLLSAAFAAAWWDYYGVWRHCWCPLEAPPSWGLFVPVVVLFFVGGSVIEAQTQGSYRALPEPEPKRMHAARASRSSEMLVMALAALSYVLGAVAVDQQLAVFYALFAVANVLLGPVLFVAHTKADAAVSATIHRAAPFASCYAPTDGARPMTPQVAPMPAAAQQPPPPPPPEQADEPPQDKDTDWKKFHKWVTDGKDGDLQKESEHVLFEQ